MAIPIDEHTLLLLHGEEIKDSSNFNVPITNSGVVASSTQSKFGGKSLYFDGSSRLEIPSNSIIYGNDDFTIDWWEYVIDPNSQTRYCSQAIQGGKAAGIAIGCNQTKFYATSAVGTWNIVNGDSFPGNSFINNTVNTWVHWAFVRNGNTITSYRDGQKYRTAPFNGIPSRNENDPHWIGAYIPNYEFYFKGYMDEFRISNVARWITDFTPPTEPYGQKPDFAYKMQVPVGSSKKVYARIYPRNPNDYFQTDLTNATVELTVQN